MNIIELRELQEAAQAEFRGLVVVAGRVQAMLSEVDDGGVGREDLEYLAQRLQRLLSSASSLVVTAKVARRKERRRMRRAGLTEEQVREQSLAENRAELAELERKTVRT